MTPASRNTLTLLTAGVLIAAFLGQGWQFINANSQTFDEAAHLAAGYSYLTTGDFRLNREHPPLIKMWQALPVYLVYRLPFQPTPEWWASNEEWHIGRQFLYESGVPPMRLLVLARSANLLLAAALIGLMGWWSYRFWGRAAALVAMGFAAFDPNLIAHGGTLSTDVGVTLFMVLTLYLFWEFWRRPSHALLIGVGVAMGLALASKFTALFLLPVLAVLVVGKLLLGGSLTWPGQEPLPATATLAARLRQAWGPICRVLTVAAVVLPLVYLGYGFPEWAYGLRYQIERKVTGDPSYFFFGEISSQGWWTYYPVVLLLKTPLGTLLAIGLGLLLGFSRLRLSDGWIAKPQAAVFLLIPATLLFLAMAAGRVNLGVRYLLPVYPFLFILIGYLATLSLKARPIGTIAAVLLLIATAWSSIGQAPHQLAYFNELAGGPDRGQTIVSDSNVDWGQDLVSLRSFMEQEGLEQIYLSYFGTADPAGYGIAYQALPGFGALQPPPSTAPPTNGRQVIAISVVNLQGIYLRSHQDMYRWLDERTPIARLGHSIYVYDLTDDPDGQKRVAALASATVVAAQRGE